MKALIEIFLDIQERTGFHIGDLYEEIVTEAYKDIIQSGDSVIDVGVLVGLHLYEMQKIVGPSGKVYAFEPLPEYAEKVRNKLEKNKFSNVVLFEEALGIKKELSTFHYFHKEAGYSGLQRRDTPFTNEEGGLRILEVQQDRLDNILPSDTDVSFLKLDIEGGELFALMGGERLIAKARPIIVFESGVDLSAKVYGYTKDDFFGFFDKLEMTLFYITGYEFKREDWDTPFPCWEFVALPNEKLHYSEKFTEYTRNVIKRHQ